MSFSDIFCRILPALCLGIASSANAADVPEEPAPVSWAVTLDDYRSKLDDARANLAETNQKIAEEKASLVGQNRELQNRIEELQALLREKKTANDSAAARLARIQNELKSSTENVSYIRSLLRESMQNVKSVLLPGEIQSSGEEVDGLLSGLGADRGSDPSVFVSASEFMQQRLKAHIGGCVLSGRAIDGQTSGISDGRFILLGPESYFLPEDGHYGMISRSGEGAPLPFVYPLDSWTGSECRKLLDGQDSAIPLDASGGKALLLLRSRGTLMDQVRKGGPVGAAIICIGLFGAALCLLKLFSLRSLRVDRHSKVEPVFLMLKQGHLDEARNLLTSLRDVTRNLLAAGLVHSGKSRDVVEEHLQAYLLRQRLHHERWLPSLRVIAAASPLMGLLGTVVGMVRTFSLITVFGTGNAARLSSGISEALVTTVLGLVVAIPTLVIYGYLSQQTQHALSLLEGYAVELSASMEEGGK